MENAQYASVECKDLAWRTDLLRSIKGHKDVKEAYRLTAPGGVMVERRVHRSRNKEGGYTYKRREGNSPLHLQAIKGGYSVPHGSTYVYMPPT